MQYYAGIGSRETPKSICDEMTKLAYELETHFDFTLRSGNADGADQAFASGVEKAAQIWLPWDSFNSSFRSLKPFHEYITIDRYDNEAYDSVELFHPRYNFLSPPATKLMARNYRQVVGRKGEANSQFIVCWTKDGKNEGGTAQAIRIAKRHKIPVINMFHYPTAECVIEHLIIYEEL